MLTEAEKLHGILETICHCEIDRVKLMDKFRVESRRSRINDEEEFASLVIAEVWEMLASPDASRATSVVDEKEVFKAIDRVKSRLFRQSERLKKTIAFSTHHESDLASNLVDVPDLAAANERTKLFLKEILNLPTLKDVLVFDACILNRMPVLEVAKSMGISRSDVYRHIQVIRGRFEHFLKN